MKCGTLHPSSWFRAWLTLPCFGVVFSCALGIAAAETGSDSPAPVRKTLLAHYMPWFVSQPIRGEWGKHWTGNRGQFDPAKLGKDGLPELAAHYHPLLGPYDSSDPYLIECHLLQMKLAGIDGLIVDWYGLAQLDDYPQSHQATLALFAGSAKLGLKFAVCFEDRTVERLIASGKLDRDHIAKHLSETFAWLDQNWFSALHYVRVADQPLLLNFGPIFVTNPKDWQTAFAPLTNRPRFYALNHLSKAVKADGGFTWVYPEVWKEDPSAELVQERLRTEYDSVSTAPSETIVSAFAGFNDRYEKGYPDIAHRNGETLRETLTACMAGPWPIVQLVTWNDFGEGTMIEPCHELGYSLLETVQDFRRNEAENQFLSTAADLRLPEKLYLLRKSDTTRVKSLDEVAELLASGKADAARLLLERISDNSSAEDGHRSSVRPICSGSLSTGLAINTMLASNTIGEGKRY